MENHEVVIVGAGPVGLIAAMDLAYRGVSAVVLEARSDEEPMHSRCNTTSARTMEFLRRLGCSGEYRKTGLPADYPTDVLYMTRINGVEITRYKLPSSGSRFEEDRFSHDAGWRSAERPHRSSQMFLERVLRDHAVNVMGVDLRYFHQVTDVVQSDGRVALDFTDTRSGEAGRIAAKYVMACDGGRSTLRRQLGIRMEGGATGLGRTQSIFFRSADVMKNFSVQPGWMNWVINKDCFGNIIPIDGKDLWLTHCMIPEGAEGVTEEEYDRQIRQTMGCDIDYEVISIETWQFNRVVAERYRSGNVFLAGDAAHAWPPYAGHGMNTGIEDGITLSWMLAGVVQGWAPESILDAYDAERRGIGNQTSNAAAGMAANQHEITQKQEYRGLVEEPGETGAAARRYLRNRLLDVDSQQFSAEGLNFGLHYDQSPIIAYDEGVAPPFGVADYTPSTVPGCRVPHFAFVETGTPLLDLLGKGFTLLVSDDGIDTSGLADAAAAVGLPFQVIDIAHEPKARKLYDHKLVLVRPDDRIAWRANEAPADPAAVIARIRGAAPVQI
ncbi:MULTISPECIES: FAD-dependent monooxygenase [Sphingobium]|uniref:FAD-dependent monooxygenase n=1 Tax=Sphingobium TaxID=165695 RepID=UPI00159C4EA1|nr:FAD-dependent monooxygenase [Sphingobium sp. 15-1]